GAGKMSRRAARLRLVGAEHRGGPRRPDRRRGGPLPHHHRRAPRPETPGRGGSGCRLSSGLFSPETTTMRKTAGALTLLLLTGFALRAQDANAAKQELAKLEGEWKVEKIEAGGISAMPDQLK